MRRFQLLVERVTYGPAMIGQGFLELSEQNKLWLSVRNRAAFASIFIPTVVTFFIAMLLSLSRWPVPRMHDDFSNLLVAETLLHGRFSNPTPLAFESMESFHVVMTPTYASKFPIGPGAFLALGKLLFATPVAGLWISAAFATACISWMMLSHVRARWAFATGMFVALHPSWQNGWAQEFTHGWLPMAGVALVFGGVLRIRRRSMESRALQWSACRAASAIALGCVLVLFSRPFDGGIVCMMLIASLIPTIVSQGWYQRPVFWRTAAPGFSILLVGCSLQLLINLAVTGRATQLPYQLHEEQYGVAPLFIWALPHEPKLEHRFEELRTFHRTCSYQSWKNARSLTGYCELMSHRLSNVLGHWGGVLATFPFALLLWPRRRRHFTWLFAIACIAILLINCVPWVMPAYVASLIPIAIFAAVVGIRGGLDWYQQFADRDESERSGQGSRKRVSAIRVKGEYAFLALLLTCHLAALGITSVARASLQADWKATWAEERSRLVDQLEQTDGNHLVLVQYEPGHDVQEEWVYNHAAPERSRIIWARFADPALNNSLLQSYPNRTVWSLSVPSVTLKLATQSNRDSNRSAD